MAKAKGTTGKHKTENPAYAAAMRELRRSNASGIHEDRRTKRLRSRAAVKANAVRDFA